MSGLQNLKVPQLKGLCKHVNISATGKKADLIARLEQTPHFQPPPISNASTINAQQQILTDLLSESLTDTSM